MAGKLTMACRQLQISCILRVPVQRFVSILCILYFALEVVPKLCIVPLKDVSVGEVKR
jgi:hypothetical protein